MSNFITPNMGLTVPVPLSEPGPDFAEEISNDLPILDLHDHTTGKGVKVPVQGLDFNADVDINNNYVQNAIAYRMKNNGADLVGTNDKNETYTLNGDLYFKNNNGTSVKITNLDQLNITTAIASTYAETAINTTTVIPSNATYNYIKVDSRTTAITITLPAISLVSSGRFFQIKDFYGNAFNHNITILANGSDKLDSASSIVVDQNYLITELVSDGTSNWMVKYSCPASFISNNFGNLSDTTQFFGNSVNIFARSSNAVNIGAAANTIDFIGAQFLFGFIAGNKFQVDAADFFINTVNGTNFSTPILAHSDVTIGDSSSNSLVVNSASTFNANSQMLGTLQVFNTFTAFGTVNLGDAPTDLITANGPLGIVTGLTLLNGSSNVAQNGSITQFLSTSVLNVRTPIIQASRGRSTYRHFIGSITGIGTTTLGPDTYSVVISTPTPGTSAVLLIDTTSALDGDCMHISLNSDTCTLGIQSALGPNITTLNTSGNAATFPSTCIILYHAATSTWYSILHNTGNT